MNTQSIDISLYQKGDIEPWKIFIRNLRIVLCGMRARCYLVNFMLKM